MKARNLILDRIYDSNLSLNFSDENNFLTSNDVEKLRKGIILALYGDDSIDAGCTSFSFTLNDDDFLIKRDFDKKQVAILKNEKALTKLTSDFLTKLIGLDKAQFEKMFVIEKGDFEKFCASPNEYFESVLLQYGINNDIFDAKVNAYKEEIALFQQNLDYLNSLKENTTDKSANIQAEIDKIEQDLNEVNRKIFLADEVNAGAKSIEKLNGKLLQSKETNACILNYKKELEKSEKIEKELFLVNKNIEIADENKALTAQLNNLNSKLDLLRKEQEENDATLQLLENEYRFSEENYRNLTSKFEKFVLTPIELDDKQLDINQQIAEFYADYDKKAEELDAEIVALSSEYDNTVTELDAVIFELNQAKYPFATKKATREGLVLEAKLNEKNRLLEKLNIEIDEAKLRVALLNSHIARNKTALVNAKAKTADKLGRDVSLDDLYKELNNNEMHKQELYRNQIIIANTEREISAVDNKIYENEEAQRSYIEDKNVLDNAKQTLLGYIEKLNDKITSIEDKLVTVNSQKKHYESIDSASYGDRCPICKNNILEKTDISKEIGLVNKAHKDLIAEKQKANLVKKDYDAQLDKVNMRLGELTNRINTSIIYLNSLKETKEAKLDLIKKLLELSHVKNFSSMATALDAAIKKVAITTNEFIEVGKFARVEEYLKQGIEDAQDEINNIEGKILPRTSSLKTQTTTDVENIKQQLLTIYEEIGDTTSLEKSAAISLSEENEDILNEKIDNLREKKSVLWEKMASLEKEIISIVNRDNTILVQKDGKGLTYLQLFSALLSEKYSCSFNEIKQLQDNTQALKDQYLAKLLEAQAKANEINSLCLDTEKISLKLQSNTEMINFLNQNAGFDATDLGNINPSKADVLDDDKKKELTAYINDNDNTEQLITLQIKALEENLKFNQTYVDTYKENVSVKNSLLAMLKEKRALLIAEYNNKAKNDFIAKNIEKTTASYQYSQEKYENFNAIKQHNLTLFVNTANQILNIVSEKQLSLEYIDGKIKILENGAINVTAQAKALALLCLEGVILDFVREFNSISRIDRLLIISSNGFNESGITKIKEAANAVNITVLLSNQL